MQNAYIERNNGSIRRELLDAYLFYNLAEVRAMSEQWRLDYNTERPHKSLGYLSPLKYAELKSNDAALSTPASGNHSQIAAQPVWIKRWMLKRKLYLKTLTDPGPKKGGAYRRIIYPQSKSN